MDTVVVVDKMVRGERKGKPQFWWTDLRTGIPPQVDIIGLQRKEMSCILRNGVMPRWLDDHFSMIQKKAFHVIEWTDGQTTSYRFAVDVP